MVNSVMAQERGDLAKFMKHSQRTQATFYDLSLQDARAARMSNIVQKLVSQQPITKEDIENETECMQYL